MNFTEKDNMMMKRCLHLAAKSSYRIKSNPRVGAVITYQNRVIGEGFHKEFGGPHAEIEALKSVSEDALDLLPESHMYVTLEPCFQYGKTPPCVDAILKARIPEVTICNLDPNNNTTGKSLQKLREHGVRVRAGLLTEEGKSLNKRFFVNMNSDLPFVVLKWAQSKDGFFGRKNESVWLSNNISKLVVHRWREDLDAIMVGTETVIADNPILTNRRDHGRSPLRIILDRNARIPKVQKVLSDGLPSVIFTTKKKYPKLNKYKDVIVMEDTHWHLRNILMALYKKGMTSVLVEGGAQLLCSLISNNLWHEARIIHTPVILNDGIKAPLLSGQKIKRYSVTDNNILIINNLNNTSSKI